MGRLSEIINYRKINEANKEFRRSDYWLVEIEAPQGVYFPGNDLIQIRTNSFNPGISDNTQALSKTIRTFTVKQAAKPSDISGTLSLTITDRVDQTMSYWIDQWKLAGGQRDELSGLSKDLYVSKVITATYFNINEIAIRQLKFLNCFLTDATLPEEGEGEPGLEGDITVSFSYEHFYREFDNLPLL